MDRSRAAEGDFSSSYSERTKKSSTSAYSQTPWRKNDKGTLDAKNY
jgi:hypothetical protein